MSGYPHGMKTLSPDNTMMHAVQRIGPGFEEHVLDTASPYVKPKSIIYDFDGRKRRWDIVESHPSVGVILYHAGLDAWLLVRQFRPAVYSAACREAAQAGKEKPTLLQGFTFELCAGLIDKDKPNPVIAQEEIEEEVGFHVPLESIRAVSSAVSSAGIQGSLHLMYYAQVDESMRVSAGGGLAGHGECIEVVALPVDATDDFVVDASCPKSQGLMFGLLWAKGQMAAGKMPRAAAPASKLETGALLLNSVLPA